MDFESGSLTVDDGSDLVGHRLSVSYGSTVTITGAGSTLTTEGTDNSIQIGSDGVGDMTVSAGALVKTLWLYVGNYGNGTFDLKGAGTKLVVSNDTGQHSNHDGYAGFVSVGRNGAAKGVVSIDQGVVLEVRNTTNEDGSGLSLGGFDRSRVRLSSTAMGPR